MVSVDRLLDDLWSGEPPPRAVGSLQAFVSNLRRTLEPDRPPRSPARRLVSLLARVRAARSATMTRSTPVAFERMVGEGGRLLAEGRPVQAGETFDAALALWRGDAYADFADEAWAAAEVARLTEWRLVAREHRMAAALAAGQAAEAVPAIEALAREHPLREGLWRLLALALYRCDRQAEALEVLRQARELLADELGIDPTPAAQLLERQLLTQAPRAGLDAAPGEHGGAGSSAVAAFPPQRTPAVATEPAADHEPHRAGGSPVGVAERRGRSAHRPGPYRRRSPASPGSARRSSPRPSASGCGPAAGRSRGDAARRPRACLRSGRGSRC